MQGCSKVAAARMAAPRLPAHAGTQGCAAAHWQPCAHLPRGSQPLLHACTRCLGWAVLTLTPALAHVHRCDTHWSEIENIQTHRLSGLNTVLLFAPSADPRVSVKAKLGSGEAGERAGIAASHLTALADDSDTTSYALLIKLLLLLLLRMPGSMSIRYQPFGVVEPLCFVDIKASPKVIDNAFCE